MAFSVSVFAKDPIGYIWFLGRWARLLFGTLFAWTYWQPLLSGALRSESGWHQRRLKSVNCPNISLPVRTTYLSRLLKSKPLVRGVLASLKDLFYKTITVNGDNRFFSCHFNKQIQSAVLVSCLAEFKIFLS